jgi:16S rRNA (cytidine1402-2'-O)-methyltransferase
MSVEPGTLYVVGTPIGNLEDVTLRALRVLAEVDVIAAEDTRSTRTLAARHNIQTPLLSYHQHSGDRRRREILDMLRRGKSVALVSDAGMPGFSDPGADLVRACAQAGIPVTVVPGPTASSAALAASGLPARECTFIGFLPARRGERRKALERLAGRQGALVFYEAPHRLVASLEDMLAVLGDREAVCARELTKRFEEMARGALSELRARFASEKPRGEFTLVVAGAGRAEEADLTAARREVEDLVEAGLSRSRAAAHVARRTGLPRSRLYQAGKKAEEGRA